MTGPPPSQPHSRRKALAIGAIALSIALVFAFGERVNVEAWRDRTEGASYRLAKVPLASVEADCGREPGRDDLVIEFAQGGLDYTFVPAINAMCARQPSGELVAGYRFDNQAANDSYVLFEHSVRRLDSPATWFAGDQFHLAPEGDERALIEKEVREE